MPYSLLPFPLYHLTLPTSGLHKNHLEHFFLTEGNNIFKQTNLNFTDGTKNNMRVCVCVLVYM